MSSIYNSDRKIEQFFLGSQEITEMFLGNELVFSKITNNLFYKLHEFVGSLTVQNTIEAPVKSAILKGQTLVNILAEPITNHTFTIGTAIRQNTTQLQANKKYIAFIDITNVTNEATGIYIRIHDTRQNGNSVILPIKDEKFTVGLHKLIFTMPSSSYNEFEIMMGFVRNAEATVTYNYAMIIEYQDGMENWDIPYFEGMRSVKMPVLTTSNKGGTKTNILTVNEPVELRGIGNVRDELNLVTSELTERVGEITLDGSADEGWSLLRRDTMTNVFQMPTSLNVKLRSDLLSNLFDGKYIETIQDGVEVIKFNNSKIYVNISNTKATTVEDFKNYIAQQPLTIQYQLATESVKTVDLSSNKVYAYNGTTHYTCSSEEGSLIPTACIEVPVETETVE